MAATAPASAAAAAAVGLRLLAEIEETSLEEVLRQVRVQVDVLAATAGAEHAAEGSPTPAVPPVMSESSVFPVPALQRLVDAHFRDTRAPGLDIGGPDALPLVYLMAAAVVAPPCRQAVVVVDLEGRFDVRAMAGLTWTITDDGDKDTSGSLADDDLRHVHVFRVDPRAVSASVLAAAQQRVLYGPQRQRDRTCWGMLVVGGGASMHVGTGDGAGAVRARTGLYGWLRVDASVEDDVHLLRQQYEQLLAHPGQFSSRRPPKPITWTASSTWGSFSFQLQNVFRND